MNTQTDPSVQGAQSPGPPDPDRNLQFGDAIDLEREAENRFSLSLLPIDIFDHWDRCGDLADFVGGYFQYSFRSANSRSIVSTVVNELLENAVKYSRNKSSLIQLDIRKRQEHIVARVSNLIPRNQREHFITICRDLFERDLEELYLEKLTRGQQDHTFSGIGLILLKKDYEARLGMNIVLESDDTIRVDVLVDLAIA